MLLGHLSGKQLRHIYNSVLKAVYSAGEPDLLTRTRVLVFGSQLQILINISLHLHVYATLKLHTL